MKEKFLELCRDRWFVTELNSLRTEEEVLAFLKKNGIEVNSLEELKAALQPDKKSLDEKEMEQVAGGGLCVMIGTGFDANICFGNGVSSSDENTVGFGGTACYFLGVGAGITDYAPCEGHGHGMVV